MCRIVQNWKTTPPTPTLDGVPAVRPRQGIKPLYSEKTCRAFCQFLRLCFVHFYKGAPKTARGRGEKIRFVMEKVRERYSGFRAQGLYCC